VTTSTTTDATTSTPDDPRLEAETPEGKEERRPYVVVLMSAEMKEALKKYASQNATNPTALGRLLFAQAIGYDISSEPQPTATRQKYSSDDERTAAKKRASLKSGLLRKALFQMHNAQIKGRPVLQQVAFDTVKALSDAAILAPALEQLDLDLDAAIKAAK